MRSNIRFWSLTALWLIGLTCAAAPVPDQVPAASPPAVPVIVLGPRTETVPLDGRSLYWVDSTMQATADQVEAAGDTLPWALRERHHRYAIDDKALWFRFDAVASDDGRWYLQLGSSGIDRAQLFYRADTGRWMQQGT